VPWAVMIPPVAQHRGKSRQLSSAPEVELLGILPTQGGGHGEIRRGRAFVAKPLIDREDRFYQTAGRSPLHSVIPKYIGSSGGWMLLQDLTAGMSSPCVADIKLGTRSFEVNAPPEKAARQLSHVKGTTTLSLAIRCIDICIRRERQVVRRWDRRDGRGMDEAQLKRALLLFLPGRRRESFRRAIADVKAKLEQTYAVLPNLRLYSASVLIVYDGDNERAKMRVKIIDFAHAYADVAAEGGDAVDPAFDDNAMRGIENLIMLVSN